MLCLASLVCAAAAVSGPIALKVHISYASVLVGEAVQAHVVWRTSRPTAIVVDDMSTGLGMLQAWIDDGSGPRRYQEALGGFVDMTLAATPITPGAELRASIWLRRGSLGERAEDFLFARPGRHVIRFVYEDKERSVRAEAEPIIVDVQAPAGDDVAVLAAMLARPALVSSRSELSAVIAQNPNSRYGPYLRLRLFAARQAALRDCVDPDTGQSLARLDRTSLQAFQRQAFRLMAQELMNDPAWPRFDEERLVLAVQYSDLAGDETTAARGRATLFERFPSSEAAREQRRRDAAAASASER